VRIVQFLVVCLLGASLAVAVPAVADVPSAPYTMVAFSGAGADRVFAQDYYFDANNGGLQTSAATNGVSFTGTTAAGGNSAYSMQMGINANGQTLAAGSSYPVSGPYGTNVQVVVNLGDEQCYPSGTLTVTELVTDPMSGDITSLAADLTSATCETNFPAAASFDVSFRFNSSQGFDAIAVSNGDWDYGQQITGMSGQPKTFTYTNEGTDAVTYGTVDLGAAPLPFTPTADTCSGQTIQPGAACLITVAPTPRHSVSSTYSGSAVNMTLPVTAPTGILPRAVYLTEAGQATASTYVTGGPERAVLTMGALPAPADATFLSYQVNWGLSATNLTKFRDVQPDSTGYQSATTTFTGLSPATNYYFRVREVFYEGGYGDWTQVIAARPWPIYSAGMYHRNTPFRLTSSHHVYAGHPYTLSAAGLHGIPKSHVEALAINVTASNPSSSTSVRVYASGSKAPAPADISVGYGETRSDFAIVPVSASGKFVVSTSHGTTPITVDVSGYFSGSGLTGHGVGAALQEFPRGGTLVDTAKVEKKALPGGYYLSAAMNFEANEGQHVTSLLLAVTAYGSKGSGSITAYGEDAAVPGTSVLSYSPGLASTATAIVAASPYFDDTNYNTYPAVSFLNRGKHSVQLRVTTLGYFDDGSFDFGQRYTPTAPIHLLTSSLGSGSSRLIATGKHAGEWSTAMNLMVSAGSPSKTTGLALWPHDVSGVTSAVQPQLHAGAHLTTVADTVEALGDDNRFSVKNSDGSTKVEVWEFGRFDAYPLPTTPDYVGAPVTAVTTMPTVLAAAAPVSAVLSAPVFAGASVFANTVGMQTAYRRRVRG
jgi:hypothetical protein